MIFGLGPECPNDVRGKGVPRAVLQDTKPVRPRARQAAPLDATDRRLLALLAEDATLSYAELGQRLHLSPPAVHERVKRLRRDGVIRGTVARLDGAKLGRPLLTFVHVDTAGWGKSQSMLALADLPEVEEIHAVTGDACLILKVRTEGTQALEDFLARIYAVEGVRGTRSYVVLSSHVERGPRPA
jgi:Lrp/AsnC family transcriptional regulator, leucine-responsive regulatory protein